MGEHTTDSTNIGGVALALYLLVIYIAFQVMDKISFQNKPSAALILGGVVIAWGIAIVGVVQGRKWGVLGTLVLGGLTTLVLLTGGTILLTVILVIGVLYVVSNTDQLETPGRGLRE